MTEAALTYKEKTKLIEDLRATYTIWSRDHGLREAMIIATGGGDRFVILNNALCDARDALRGNTDVRRVVEHALSTIEAT